MQIHMFWSTLQGEACLPRTIVKSKTYNKESRRKACADGVAAETHIDLLQYFYNNALDFNVKKG